MQSLLDPEKFGYAGERWLAEIREKLREFKATEGLLPQVEAEELDPAKAAEIKHSPLPVWLEALVSQYTLSQGGQVRHDLDGILHLGAGEEARPLTTEAEVALNNPAVEHLTLQHWLTQRLLTSVGDFDFRQGMPVLRAREPDETPGYWSLWEVSARNTLESKRGYLALFWTERGKVYGAYGNDIWNRLLSEQRDFEVGSPLDAVQAQEILQREEELLQPVLQDRFDQLAAELKEQRARRLANRQRSYEFQVSRVRRIGIDNIREAKLRQLAQEQEAWLRGFEQEQAIVPGIKHLISLRLDASSHH